MSKSCGECKHWSQVGEQPSGISLPNSDREWIYAVGQCAMGCERDADGRITGNLGLPLRTDMDVPEWSSCWLWKKRRAA